MITKQHTEEGLSRACVQAISARAGFNLSNKEFDYGVDGSLDEVSYIDGRRCESGYSLNFQLKASILCKENENFIVYDLEVKTHNDLVWIRDNGAIPCILILLALPEDEAKWLKCEENQVAIGGTCYWYYPTTDKSSNINKVRIKIPRQQIFSPEAVTALFNKLRVEGKL
jgi:hypothetical protein